MRVCRHMPPAAAPVLRRGACRFEFYSRNTIRTALNLTIEINQSRLSRAGDHQYLLDILVQDKYSPARAISFGVDVACLENLI